MSSCACYKMCCSNVLFFYLSTLSFTRFSASFASFLKNVHNVVIGNLCTSPLPSLRRFLEMKMHYRKHVSCRKCFALLRWKSTVYRKSALLALSRLLVARNLEMGYYLQDQFSLNNIVNFLNQFTVFFCSIRALMFYFPTAIIFNPIQVWLKH